MLTEKFKTKFMRIASEEGFYGPFDWDKIEERLKWEKENEAELDKLLNVEDENKEETTGK